MGGSFLLLYTAVGEVMPWLFCQKLTFVPSMKRA